ncbi:MAG: transporter substrate-binding domain-containing protein [Aliarcobacter sp.]|nr:transporter substrate-binding domain-containing protein [Aliarcobacter sp.]
MISLSLNHEENNYLENKKEINICIDPDWMPFEKIKNNKHIGISADYMKLIENKIGIPITLIETKNWSQSLKYTKEKKCDILPLTMRTPQRETYLNFTSTYIKLPLVIAGDINSAFIENIDQIKDEKIGISKDHAYEELLKAKYPHVNFVEVENVEDGLKQIENK